MRDVIHVVIWTDHPELLVEVVFWHQKINLLKNTVIGDTAARCQHPLRSPCAGATLDVIWFALYFFLLMAACCSFDHLVVIHVAH